MVVIIGGETHKFRPLMDMYREAGAKAGHELGYVANTSENAVNEYFPGYAEAFTSIGKERGGPPITRLRFNEQAGLEGALIVGNPEQVAEKMIRHCELLGGISRLTFQMDNAALPHEKLLQSIELIGSKVMPLVTAAK